MPGLHHAALLLVFPVALLPISPNRLTRRLVLPRTTPIVIRATVGEIAVTGWDRPDIDIEILTPGMSASIDASGPALTIEAVQAGDRRDAEERVAIAVRAPADQVFGQVALFEGRIALRNLHNGVTATVEHGSIDADALSGIVRLETGIGDVRLSHAQLAERGLIRLRTFNGNVDLGFAALPADARILALSLGGAIRSDIPLRLKTQFGPRFGEATLGRGVPVVSIDVVNGDIRITAGRTR